MVIIGEIDNFTITKVLVDQVSLIYISYLKTFKRMRIPKSEIHSYDDQIVGFSGERVDTRGFNDLYTTFREEGYLCKTIKIRYLLENPSGMHEDPCCWLYVCLEVVEFFNPLIVKIQG